jgi:hypothetical protein
MKGAPWRPPERATSEELADEDRDTSLYGGAARRLYLFPSKLDVAAELKMPVPFGLGSGEAAELGVVRGRFRSGSPSTG